MGGGSERAKGASGGKARGEEWTSLRSAEGLSASSVAFACAFSAALLRRQRLGWAALRSSRSSSRAFEV